MKPYTTKSCSVINNHTTAWASQYSVLITLLLLLLFWQPSNAAAITIDGNTSDWTEQDRIDTPTVANYKLYGRYEGGNYKLLLQSDTTAIGVHTTIWLNTDQNATTGYQIWGSSGGAEYNVNLIYGSQPYLYTGDAAQNQVAGPLTHAFSANSMALELEIPETLIGTPSGTGINLLLDVNNTVFMPTSFDNQYTLSKGTVWTEQERIDTPAVADYKLYGRYENGHYKLRLQSTNGTPIGLHTTIWLNTDQNAATGYQIWGSYGGAEYNVNLIYGSQPYLYTGDAAQNQVAGPLSHAFSASNTVLDLDIPETLIGTPGGTGINLLLDVNNTVFMPVSFDNQYTLNKGITWTEQERIDTPAVANYKLYGRYENGVYKLHLESSNGTPIEGNTTFWLNTDQNTATGYQIWGWAGGAEYNVDINAALQPYLYTGDAAQNQVAGPLTHSFSNNNTVLDLTIPETLIGTPGGTGINLLLDINNTVFMPASFSNQYTLKKSAPPVPGTAADKRIGIVYSATSASRFWSSKNYAQLFMSMQAQAMQAGIPFDMLTEDDLLDLNKVVKYDTLVFPSFTFVPASKADAIATNLNIAAFQYQIGLVTAGSFMTNDETGAALPGDPYSRMKTLFGITREGGNASPTAVNVKVSNVTHPITQGEYTLAETNILAYPSVYTEYYTDSGTYPATSITPIATQTVSGATHNAVLAIQPTDGGRNVHFATVQQMTDANLLWSALRWSAIGAAPEAGITLGRNKALFLSRNDMDMSMYANVFNDVEPPLLTFLQSWKTQYNFVGSYYLDVGNNPAGNIYTNWAIAKPLYDQYLALGNEIGNHSYTHPFDTNTLPDAEFPFEFGDARTTIEQNMELSNIGTAIPGAPDTLETANKILPHAGTYLSGGYSGTGAGINNAFGYLSPADTKVYLSPNMTFDFTNIEFLKLSATATLSKWNTEFDALTRHAKRAIIHWPWHDYGPTIGSQADFCDTRPAPCEPYSVAMFHDLIAKAYQFGVEFITGADMSQRINSFRNSRLETTTVNASTVTASLQSTNAGRFGLDIPQATGATKIKSVNGWYAYNDNQVFSDRDGGSFTVNLGTSVDAVTHITELPSRAELVSLSGTGEDLNFTLAGEGSATILTQCAASSTPTVTGASSFTYTQASKTLTLKFNTAATHNVTIDVTCP